MSARHAAFSLKRELVFYNILSFFQGFVPIYPVYMILFAENGLSYSDISALILIWALPIVLLEVPSGILADRWSRKGVIVLGMVLKSLCFVAWAFPVTFASAAIGFVFWGAMEALCSGAKEAQLYDTLRKAGREASYEKAAGFAVSVETLAAALAMAIGGAIYAASPFAALFFSFASCLAAAGAALAFGETVEPAGISRQREPYFAALRDGFRECVRNAPILKLVIVSCLAGMAYELVDEYDGLLAKRWIGLSSGLVGLWGAARIATQAGGAWLSPRLSLIFRLGKDLRFGAFLLVAAASFAASAFLPVPLSVPPYFLFYFLMAAAEILVERRLQDAIEKAGRATVLSMNSLALTLSAMAAAPLFGILSDRFGIRAVIVLSAVLTALAAVFFEAPKKRSSSRYHKGGERGG